MKLAPGNKTKILVGLSFSFFSMQGILWIKPFPGIGPSENKSSWKMKYSFKEFCFGWCEDFCCLLEIFWICIFFSRICLLNYDISSFNMDEFLARCLQLEYFSEELVRFNLSWEFWAFPLNLIKVSLFLSLFVCLFSFWII